MIRYILTADKPNEAVAGILVHINSKIDNETMMKNIYTNKTDLKRIDARIAALVELRDEISAFELRGLNDNNQG